MIFNSTAKAACEMHRRHLPKTYAPYFSVCRWDEGRQRLVGTGGYSLGVRKRGERLLTSLYCLEGETETVVQIRFYR